MKSIKSKLVVGAGLAAMLSTPVFAQEVSTPNNISNDQSNWAQIRAELNGNITNVSGEVNAVAAAIGNSFTAEVGGLGNVTNTQHSGREWGVGSDELTATLNITPHGHIGDLEATAAAIANSASITVDGTVAGENPLTNVNSTQTSTSNSTALLNAVINGVDNDISLTSAAINNSLAINSTGRSAITSSQTSAGPSSATLNFGSDIPLRGLEATVATIGNSVTAEFTTAEGLSQINNTQSAEGTYVSNLNATIDKVCGHCGDTEAALQATNASIANSLSVEGTGDLTAVNNQTFMGDAMAHTNMDINTIVGGAEIVTVAMANSATFDMSETGNVNITSTQTNGVIAAPPPPPPVRWDPYAETNLAVGTIIGDAEITSAAISNNLSVSTLPATASVNVDATQNNSALTQTDLNATIDSVTGDLDLTSVAIGNSVNIVNLPDL